jgi:tripartite-type tricarboxylate transporter receptor subunit TctC
LLALADIKMVHVPYKGSGGALVDLLAGQVVSMTTTILSGMSYVRANRLRALGVTSAKRSAVLPDVPAIAETVPGYEAVQWYGVLGPAALPREIVTKMHGAVTRAVQDAAVRERFLADGVEPVGSTPEEFAALIRAELTKWEKVIKSAGIKAES